MDSPQKRKNGTTTWKWRSTCMEEVDEDVASHVVSQTRWTSRARLRWRKTKTGRRRAHRVGSGGARSSLPTIQEAKACDAFLETMGDTEPDEFARPGLHGRTPTVFTSTPRAVLGGTQNKGRVLGVPRLASTGSLCGGFSKDWDRPS
eukprot:4584815-Amphidinium_carterae.1